jgi:hypothetical protein
MWSFLAVQALFLAWVIVGCATAHNGASPSDVASQCSGNSWRVLYSSYGDCAKSVNDTMSAAGTIGTGIGLALVVGLWVAVDIILGVTRMVVVFSRRGRHQ